MDRDGQIDEIRAAVVCPACAFPTPVPTGSSVAVCACGAIIRVPAIPTWPPMAREISDEIPATRPEMRAETW